MADGVPEQITEVYEAAGGTAFLRILWFTVLVLAVAGILIVDCAAD